MSNISSTQPNGKPEDRGHNKATLNRNRGAVIQNGGRNSSADAIVTGRCACPLLVLLDCSIFVFPLPGRRYRPCTETCHIDSLFPRKKPTRDKKVSEQIGRLCYKQRRWNAMIADNKRPIRLCDSNLLIVFVQRALCCVSFAHFLNCHSDIRFFLCSRLSAAIRR